MVHSLTPPDKAHAEGCFTLKRALLCIAFDYGASVTCALDFSRILALKGHSLDNSFFRNLKGNGNSNDRTGYLEKISYGASRKSWRTIASCALFFDFSISPSEQCCSVIIELR